MPRLLNRPVTSSRSILRVARTALISAWRPLPLATPQLDRNLTDLPAPERVASILHYNLLKIEHAISSNGGIRAWLKLNFLLFAFLAIPAFFFVPIISWLISQFAGISISLAIMAQNLLMTVLALVGITITLVILLVLLKVILPRQSDAFINLIDF